MEIKIPIIYSAVTEHYSYSFLSQYKRSSSVNIESTQSDQNFNTLGKIKRKIERSNIVFFEKNQEVLWCAGTGRAWGTWWWRWWTPSPPSSPSCSSSSSSFSFLPCWACRYSGHQLKPVFQWSCVNYTGDSDNALKGQLRDSYSEWWPRI